VPRDTLQRREGAGGRKRRPEDDMATEREKEVTVRADTVELPGFLTVPEGAQAAVVFAHGSGSSRLSPRNRFVAGVLNRSGIATLLFDLLTEEEDRVYERRFDIGLLTERLMKATVWLKGEPEAEGLSLGFFGASTGAAAALAVAAEMGADIGAVVSRGGRPDMAPSALGRVRAPVLLIVGERDPTVIQLNREAYDLIEAEKDLRIVAGATHLFEEPGALEQVADLAARWFTRHLLASK
jgi:putative phosphoribosyl transferase